MEVTGIGKLIMDTLDKGYDIKITMRLRDDRSAGSLTMPNSWVRALGGDVEALRKSEIQQSK